jgi:exodeoxyribonuclease V alpha subunit
MSDLLVDAFVPLARLTLGDGYDGKIRERWIRPLAQLLEAASRGKGQLPLSQCPVDGDAPPEFFTLVNGMVLLPRNAAYWSEVRDRIETLHRQATNPLSDAAVGEALAGILPPIQERSDNGVIIFDNGEQRLAIAAFVDARIGVLTGGPGTGKTTSAAALLAMRKRLEPQLSADDVLLCAPTGKAACRLAESMKAAASRLGLETVERDFLCALVPRTIHKALEWGPKAPEQGGPFSRRTGRPLTQRLVLVDEASMVDLHLMTHLLRALSAQASLLLLGDSDQLESVDTGGVLAELVSRGAAGQPAPDQLKRWRARLRTDAQQILDDSSPPVNGAAPLPGLVVRLRHSYRAKKSPWILELAAIAKPGASGTVADFLACCWKRAPNIRLHGHRMGFSALCREQWQQAQKTTVSWTLASHPSDSELNDHLKRFQLLCGDNAQVDRANRIGTAALWGDSAQRGGLGLPHGCPVLVTQNRPALGLSNGDVGVALGSAAGQAAQVVFFPGIVAPIPIAQLPEHQPAFALTIHKSQGSEWEKVAIDLPSESELLDRNLLYTAISRSSGTLELYADVEKALAPILSGPYEAKSGRG